jgi:hypothetical protein
VPFCHILNGPDFFVFFYTQRLRQKKAAKGNRESMIFRTLEVLLTQFKTTALGYLAIYEKKKIQISCLS